MVPLLIPKIVLGVGIKNLMVKVKFVIQPPKVMFMLE